MMIETRAGWACLWVLTCGVALLAGDLAATSGGPLLLAAMAVVTVTWVALSRWGVGCVLGLLILGGLDALPGPNLELSVLNSITPQDFVIAMLVLLLLYMNSRDGFSRLRQTRPGRLLLLWAPLFLAWYAFTVVRTWLGTPVPLIHAVTFSRQFLYFPILLPLLYGALGERRVRNTMLGTVAVGALVAAVAQSLYVAGHYSLSFLVHLELVGKTAGLTRLYTAASDIPFAALPLGYGLVLYGRTGRLRILGAVLAIASAIAVALGLTRAMYAGEIIGLGCVLALTLLNTGVRASAARRRFIWSSIALGVAIALVASSLPSRVASTAVNGVTQRASSLVAIINGSPAASTDSAVLTRQYEITTVEWGIRGHWLEGVGELDPTYAYVSGVPQGNIDQIDVSLLGAVAEIGIIGVALYAIPLVVFLVGLIRERLTNRTGNPDDWIAFGGLAWCIGAIVVSPTLGLFFRPSQVVGSALMLALVAGVLAERGALNRLPGRSSLRP